MFGGRSRDVLAAGCVWSARKNLQCWGRNDLSRPARKEIGRVVIRGRRFWRKDGRSGDDLGGLGQGRESARHERGQRKHQTAKADQHWRGSFLRRVSGEMNLGRR